MKEIIDEFVDQNWQLYKSWLAEHIGYAGGMDWDSTDTRIAFYEEEKDNV